jgi:hypothetical protein
MIIRADGKQCCGKDLEFKASGITFKENILQVQMAECSNGDCRRIYIKKTSSGNVYAMYKSLRFECTKCKASVLADDSGLPYCPKCE